MVQPFYEGMFAASFEHVRDYWKHDKNVSFYKGNFPATSGPVQDKTFSLVNLDVDWYESTRQCLEFFYSHMSPGGVILSHDFKKPLRVRKAFNDLFENETEPVPETAGSQCPVVKV